VGYIKRTGNGSLLYLEEARTGRYSLATTSMRKYPGTTDFGTIANSTLPSNARSDTGDVRIVNPDGSHYQKAKHGTGQDASDFKTFLSRVVVRNPPVTVTNAADSANANADNFVTRFLRTAANTH
jgi:hypothetical protein